MWRINFVSLFVDGMQTSRTKDIGSNEIVFQQRLIPENNKYKHISIKFKTPSL